MVRSIRMFEIIQILRNASGPRTAENIANSLGISKRTAYRDIAALQAARVPIDGEVGVGYILRPGFDLPPIAFSPDEIEAITVGLALLSRTGDSGLQRAARRVFSKIDDSLPDTSSSQDKFAVSHWNEVPVSHVDVGTIRKAIREEQTLQVTYCNVHEVSTERTILPLALIYYVDAIVVAAWCELRSDFRHFRVDRIIDLKAVTKPHGNDVEALRNEWKDLHSV